MSRRWAGKSSSTCPFAAWPVALRSLLAALALWPGFSAAASTSPAAPEAKSPAPAPPRLVSLAPNLTELAYAAGAGGLLVGTVEWSDYPAAAQALPRVGDAWRLDYERVLALRPDAALAWPGGTPASVTDRLRTLGLEVIEVPSQRLADVPAALRQLGRLAGTSAVAERAAREFEARVATERAQHASAPALSVFIQIDDAPVYTVNGRHVISEVVELCGGRNVFASLPQLAPPIAVEAVLAADPQVIVSTDDTIDNPLAQWQRWPRLQAVQAGTVYSLPSDVVTRASPRLAEGVRVTCATLDRARARLRAAGP